MRTSAAALVWMEERSERVLVATKDWRSRAIDAFTTIGRGAMTKCARDVGCSPALITKLLSGEIATSEHVGPISDWLTRQGQEVARPQAEVSSEAQRELLEEARGLDPEAFEQLLWLARRLRTKQS